MEIETDTLEDAVSDLRPLWSDDTPTSLPSASHVAFRQKVGGVELTAMNDSGWQSIPIRDAFLDEDFSVNGRELQRMLKRVPTDRVIIEPLTTNVRFKSADDHFVVKRRARWEGYLVEDGRSPDPEEKDGDTLNAEEILQSAARVQYAIGGEGAKQCTQGLQLTGVGDRTRVAATDGRQAAYEVVSTSLPDAIDREGGLLIPREAVDSILSLEDDWAVANLDPELWIESGDGSELVVRPLADSVTFPPIESLVDQPTSGETVRVPRKTLKDALRAVEIAVEGFSRRLHLQFDGDALYLRTGETEEGEGAYRIEEAETPDSEQLAAYNIDYLQKAVGSFDCEEIDLHFTESGGNVMLAVTPPNSDRQVRIIIPMQVDL